MKRLLLILLSVALSLSTWITAFAGREYIGETEVKDNMLFINGNSIAAAQLPNEFVYIPVELLDYYGFDISLNNDNGYKNYRLRRDGSSDFVPKFTYNAEHYKNLKKVYSTDAKVYIDSDIPANAFELEDGTVLIQSDELAKYGTYNWDAVAHTISINFESDSFMPVGQPFHNVLGLNHIEEIESGVIVRADGKCADIETEDLKAWLNVYWDFAPFDRVISPYDPGVYRESYIKLWTKNKTKSFIVYPNGGVIVGSYGTPCDSHGETKKNYIWYLPYIGNGRNALYTADTKLSRKYIIEQADEFIGKLRDVTPNDIEVIPENNLLITDSASDWSKPEIEKAAACNLLPYELTDKYKKNITRQQFCDLIYRLIATEFYPYSDSRMGEWSTIDNIIDERQLRQKLNSVSFTDCQDDRIKFLSGAGIILGMGDGTFAPDSSIKREQAATILSRTAEFLGNKKIIKPSYVISYSDEEFISEWAKFAIWSMRAMNIMKGVSETEFDPQGSYTVEQAIATMIRLYECY